MPQIRFSVFLLLLVLCASLWILTFVSQLSDNVDVIAGQIRELRALVETLRTEGEGNPGRHKQDRVHGGQQNVQEPVKPEEEELKRDPAPTIQGFSENNTERFHMPRLDGINVISMSLWGSDGRYTNGAVENAQLIKVFFPGWILRIYTEKRNSGSAASPRYPVVPIETLDRLRSLGAEVEYIDPREVNVPAMMWRFLVADDLSVDRFIVRDTDSRLSSRDAAGVYQWTLSRKPFHCVRDHPSHAAYAVSGGLWGGNPSGLRDIFRRPFKEIMFGFKTGYMEDMKFLIDIVWPRVQHKAFCSDSVSCEKYPASHPYPVARHGYEFVGEVHNAQGLRRPEDITILKNAGENAQCVPPKS